MESGLKLAEAKTPEQDKKKLRKDFLKKRLYAFGIDLFAIAIMEKVLFFAFIDFANDYMTFASPSFKSSLWSDYYKVRFPLLFTTYFSYFFLSLYMSGGKTLGKTIMNLRVLSHEGDPDNLSLAESFMRSLGYFFCYVTGSFLFAIPFLRKDTRGLPDWFSQTEVLHEADYQQYLEELKNQKDDIDPQLELFESKDAA